jgi:hypothetical protein
MKKTTKKYQKGGGIKTFQNDPEYFNNNPLSGLSGMGLMSPTKSMLNTFIRQGEEELTTNVLNNYRDSLIPQKQLGGSFDEMKSLRNTWDGFWKAPGLNYFNVFNSTDPRNQHGIQNIASGNNAIADRYNANKKNLNVGFTGEWGDAAHNYYYNQTLNNQYTPEQLEAFSNFESKNGLSTAWSTLTGKKPDGYNDWKDGRDDYAGTAGQMYNADKAVRNNAQQAQIDINKDVQGALSNSMTGIFSGLDYMNSYEPPEKIKTMKGFQGIQYKDGGYLNKYQNGAIIPMGGPNQGQSIIPTNVAIPPNYNPYGFDGTTANQNPYGFGINKPQIPQATTTKTTSKAVAKSKPKGAASTNITSDGALSVKGDDWQYKKGDDGKWYALNTTRPDKGWMEAKGEAANAIQRKIEPVYNKEIKKLVNSKIPNLNDEQINWEQLNNQSKTLGVDTNYPYIEGQSINWGNNNFAGSYPNYGALPGQLSSKDKQEVLQGNIAALTTALPIGLIGKGLTKVPGVSNVLKYGANYIDEAGNLLSSAGTKLGKAPKAIIESSKDFFKKGSSIYDQEVGKTLSSKTANLAEGLTRLPNGRIAKITDTRGTLQKIMQDTKISMSFKNTMTNVIKNGQRLSKEAIKNLSPKEKNIYEDIIKKSLKTPARVNPRSNMPSTFYNGYQMGGEVNLTGFTPNTPTMNNKINIIPSGITDMSQTPINILAIGKKGADHGLIKLLQANSQGNTFKSNYTVELPMASKGGYISKYQYGGVIGNPNNSYSLPILPYLSDELGFTELQAEDREVIFLPDGTISEVKADKKHKHMDKNKVTDIGPSGAYIFSMDKKMKFSPESSISGIKLKDMKLGKTAFEYKENEVTPGPQDIMLKDIFFKNNKEITTADIARNIKNKFPLIDMKYDPFASKANEENKSQRIENLEILKAFNEFKKPKPRNQVPKAQYGMPLQPTNNGFDGMMNYMDKAMDPFKRMDNNLVSMFNVKDPTLPKIPKVYEQGGMIPHASLGDLLYYTTPLGAWGEASAWYNKRKQGKENEKLNAERTKYADDLQSTVDRAGQMGVATNLATMAASSNVPLQRYDDMFNARTKMGAAYDRNLQSLEADKYAAQNSIGMASSMARYMNPATMGSFLADSSNNQRDAVTRINDASRSLKLDAAKMDTDMMNQGVAARDNAFNTRAAQQYNALVTGIGNTGTSLQDATLNSGNTRYKLGMEKMSFDEYLKNKRIEAGNRARQPFKSAASGLGDGLMFAASMGMGSGAGAAAGAAQPPQVPQLSQIMQQNSPSLPTQYGQFNSRSYASPLMQTPELKGPWSNASDRFATGISLPTSFGQTNMPFVPMSMQNAHPFQNPWFY